MPTRVHQPLTKEKHVGVWTRVRAAATVTALTVGVGAQVLVGQAQAAPAGCQPRGAIGQAWNSMGGNSSALGPCVTDEGDFFTIKWELFVNGIVLWTPMTGPVPLVWGPPAPQAGGSSHGAAALDAARTMVGTPYVYGGSQPGGFDCSGLVQWSFGRAGVGLPRTTFDQIGTGLPVARNQLQPGDVVFFYGGGHNGIYAGNNQVIHAPDVGQTVSYADMSYMDFFAARRY